MAFEQDGARQDELLPKKDAEGSFFRWAGTLSSAGTFLKGVAVSVLGINGLEGRWAFPLGYWAVELLVAFGWIASVGLLGQISAG